MTDGRGTTKNSNRSQEYHHRTSSYAKMHSTQVAVATTQTIRPQAHKQSIMALMGMIAWITNIGHCCLHSLPCVLTYLQRQTSPPRPYTLHTHVLAQSVVNFCSNANTHYGFLKKKPTFTNPKSASFQCPNPNEPRQSKKNLAF